MNTYASASRFRSTRPARVSALLACLLIAALLLPGSAGWTAQAAPPAQEAQPDRRSYDGLFDLPRQPGVVPQGEAGQPLLAPEYVDWSRLVFQSARNESDWEIYSARGDGANQVNISNHGSMDIHPRLNRGATRVVFASNRHGGYDLFTMDANGGGQNRVIDHPGDDVYPAWSPDGSRIAFQSYRNSQPQIYVVNADGSGLVRLTYHGDYDGQPTWSPDGSQIAFVRRESGGYRIWAMNADGSNQRRLSNQAYSADPAWSPDGSQIAYDADGNGDGWQEIWLMNADGSNQRQVYDPPEGNTDAWVGSWSPDGRYVAFTRISFVYYQGQWYWTYAYLDAWDSAQPWSTIRLSSDGADWNPAWASIDIQAPTSRVQPLPTESPGPFTVTWTGNDSGGSGLKSYDVQIKDGANGAWSNWKTNTTDASGSYPGVGGRTYYFRSRARDHAGNVEAWPASHDTVTTVEANPPASYIAPMPAYTKGIYVQVAWDGWDPGGSGIREFRIQCRDRAGGDWFDCISAVTQPGSVSIQGTLGHTYEYRSIATDRAGNVEPWPPEGGDTHTTLYSWHIASTVRDNRGAPVAGPLVTSVPAALITEAGETDGSYITYVAEAATSYGVAWSKIGYGALPTTTLAGYPDGNFAAVLPPAPGDNLVSNWGFEDGAPGSAWQTGGTITPILSTRSAHSGRNGMRLGWRDSAFTPPNNVSQLDGYSHQINVVSGDDGALHAMWVEAAGANAETSLYHATRNSDGLWSTPVQVSGRWSAGPQMARGQEGRVYAVWTQDYNRIYFSQRPRNGEWSSPVMISNPAQGDAYQPRLAVDGTGAVHVIWSMPNYYQPPVSYVRRDVNGTWSTPVVISDPSVSGGWSPQLAVERDGAVHTVWIDNDRVFYARRTVSGSWSPPQQIFTGSFTRLAIDNSNVVHLIWTYGREILYAQKTGAGSWSQAETAYRETDDWAASDRWDVAVESSDVVHIALVPRSNSSALVYLRRLGNSHWAAPHDVATVFESFESPTATLGHDGVFHVSWPDAQEVYYARRNSQGAWSAPVNISTDSSASTAPSVVTDATGRAHVLWEDARSGATDVYHARFVEPQPAGDSWISQQITVPADINNPTLSFMIRMKDAPLAPQNAFTVSVQDGANTATLWSATQAPVSWTHRWFDLSQWKGRTITLVYRLNQAAGSVSTWVDLDEISVGPGYPDIWVSLAGDSTRPNEPIQYTITYGNRGGATGNGARVTATLPAGLVFVSATPPPSSTTTQLTWNVGNLAGNSGPFSISVTARADPPIGLGAVTNTTSITTQSPELEMHNNSAQATVFIGNIRYLPVIMR